MGRFMKDTDNSVHEENFENSQGDWLETIFKAAEDKDKEVGEITPQCNLDDEHCEACSG